MELRTPQLHQMVLLSLLLSEIILLHEPMELADGRVLLTLKERLHKFFILNDSCITLNVRLQYKLLIEALLLEQENRKYRNEKRKRTLKPRLTLKHHPREVLTSEGF